MSNRSSRTLAAAAMTGLIAGASAVNLNCNRPSSQSGSSTRPAGAAGQTAGASTQTAGTEGETAMPEKHSCRGKNACKGQGGCGSGDNGCKGKNSCKGKGGCHM